MNIGSRFGRLVVVGFARLPIKGEPNQSRAAAECKCDCGAVLVVRRSHLTSGNTKACGNRYLHRRIKVHGMCELPEYRTWKAIRRRCHAPNSSAYRHYGGRGITVCERWSSFENFIADMGRMPVGFSIERVDNNKGYTPENCIWIPRAKQSANRRNCSRLRINGEEMCRADAARLLRLSPSAVSHRVARGYGIWAFYG